MRRLIVPLPAHPRRFVLGIVTSLALLAGVDAHAASLTAEEAAYLAHPADPLRRLDMIRSEGMGDARAEEAIEGLRPLLSDPGLGSSARTQMIQVVLEHPPRAGWKSIYETLVRSSQDGPTRTRLQLQAARASILGGEITSAVTALRALNTAAPDNNEIRLLLGHALLLSGDADGAQAVLRTMSGSTQARRGVMLASLAGADDKAYWMGVLKDAGFSEGQIRARLGDDRPDGGTAQVDALRVLYYEETPSDDGSLEPTIGPAEQPLLQSAQRAPIIARARALQAAGYHTLAINVVAPEVVRPLTADGTHARADLLQLLGNLQSEAGDHPRAEKALREALAMAPDDDDIRMDLVQALRKATRYREALTELGSRDDGLQKKIYAEYAVAQAVANRDPTDDAPAYANAWELSSANPDIARGHGKALARAGHDAEAIKALEIALAADPTDMDALTALANALVTEGRAGEAIAHVHTSCAAPLTTAERKTAIDTLGYLWVAQGEAYKKQGDIDEAARSYLQATLLRPDSVDVLRALGGALWQGGRLDEAYGVYQAAWSMKPSDEDLAHDLVQLALATGREGTADAILSEAGRDPRLSGVRQRIEETTELDAAYALAAAGRHDEAIVAFRKIRQRRPRDVEALKGLGTSLIAVGRYSEAVAVFRDARSVAPLDPWARLGHANALAAGGQPEDAEDVLDTIQPGTDATLTREVSLARARVLLALGNRAAEQNRDEAAFEYYRQSLAIHTDTWVLTGLGGLYLRHDQLSLAAAFYDEALDLDPDNTVARRGRIQIMARSGQIDTAYALASELKDDSKDTRSLLAQLEVARGLRDAERLRRSGQEAEADDLIADLRTRYPDDDGVKAAWISAMLTGGTASERLERARSILLTSPTNEQALTVALYAAHELHVTDSAMPLIETAVARGAKIEDLHTTARIAVLLDRAREQHLSRRHEDAVRTVRSAEASAARDPDRWSLIGGTWIEIGEHAEALAAFERGLRYDPDHIPSLVGRAGAIAASGKSAQGLAELQREYEERKDPEIGLALARLLIARGDYKQAEAVLAELPPEKRAQALEDDGLPVLALPSGRQPAIYAIGDGELSPELEARRQAVLATIPPPPPPELIIGAGLYTRPGQAGKQFLNAFFLPVALKGLGIGPVSFEIEAVPVFLNDADSVERGVSLSGGVNVAAGIASIHARLGTSPLGFANGVYLTWFGRVDFEASPAVSLGIESGRTPITDSLTSWAGKNDTDGRYGLAARTWFGGYVGVEPTTKVRFGAYGRGGWVQALDIAADPFWEVVGHGRRHFTQRAATIDVGLLGLAQSYSRQIDRFEVGQAGVFSPELFLYGAATLDATIHTKDDGLWACVGGKAGPQWIVADDPDEVEGAYVKPGFHFGYAVHGSLLYRFGRLWSVGLDASRQVTGTDWHANSVLANLRFGPRQSTPPSRSFSPIGGPAIVESQQCGR